jgi:hypothetical protein
MQVTGGPQNSKGGKKHGEKHCLLILGRTITLFIFTAITKVPQCGKPEDTDLYVDCKPLNEEDSFPVAAGHYANCKCSRCSDLVHLRCDVSGIWTKPNPASCSDCTKVTAGKYILT